MFSVKSSEVQTRIPPSVIAVVAMLLLALVLSAAAVVQVLEEYRLLGTWVAGPGPVPVRDIESLRQDIGTRIVVRSIASAVLLLGTLTTLWLQQRQLAIRRTLHQVRILANNVLASLDSGVITTDQAGVVTSINTAAIRLLGIDEECMGRPIASISSPQVPLDELRRKVTAGKAAVRDVDIVLDRAGGSRRLVASALELKDTRGTTLGCIMHLRDVTERLMLLEQMWRTEQFAELSTLASGLHHEIKNPITALSIHVQLLEEQVGRAGASEPITDLLGVLKTEVRRLNAILESFRNFASLERLVPRSSDVQEILNDIARLVRPQASQQGVRIELPSAEQELPSVTVDREKIEQAVLNLVLNALEAMPGGGELTLRAEHENGKLDVLVADSGPGIPSDIQDHVFRPYFSTKGAGTGIGLALAEKLVRQHEGQIGFRTGPSGTTFRISLPLDASSASNGRS
jgi:PAS domain S-box-containing protein